MSLTICQMEYSPFCIPITAALRASGTEFENREIPNWDRTELLRLTDGAYYQVPVLVHDGRVVIESSADSEDIARYVDAHFAGGRLFPERFTPSSTHWRNSPPRSTSAEFNALTDAYQFLIHFALSFSELVVPPPVDQRSKVGL